MPLFWRRHRWRVNVSTSPAARMWGGGRRPCTRWWRVSTWRLHITPPRPTWEGAEFRYSLWGSSLFMATLLLSFVHMSTSVTTASTQSLALLPFCHLSSLLAPLTSPHSPALCPVEENKKKAWNKLGTKLLIHSFSTKPGNAFNRTTENVAADRLSLSGTTNSTCSVLVLMYW